MLGALLATQGAPPPSGASQPFPLRLDAIIAQSWLEDPLPILARLGVVQGGSPVALPLGPSQTLALEIAAALLDEPLPPCARPSVLPGWSVDPPIPSRALQTLHEIVALNLAPETQPPVVTRVVLPGWSVDRPPLSRPFQPQSVESDPLPPVATRSVLPGWSVDRPPARAASPLAAIVDAWTLESLPPQRSLSVPTSPLAPPVLRAPQLAPIFAWWGESDATLPASAKTASWASPHQIVRAPRSLAVELASWTDPDTTPSATTKTAAWTPPRVLRPPRSFAIELLSWAEGEPLPWLGTKIAPLIPFVGGGSGHDWRTPYALLLARQEIAGREAAARRRLGENEEALGIFLALEELDDD